MTKAFNMDEKALYKLGEKAYDRGNYTEAITYFEKLLKLESDKSNHGKALYKLGIIYHFENNDSDKANQYFERACEYDDPNVLNDIGNLYFRNSKLPYDPVKAKTLFERSVKIKQDFVSLCNLAEIYEYGSGIPKDITTALTLYIQAYHVAKPKDQVIALDKIKRIVLNDTVNFINSYVGLLNKITDLENQIYYQPDGPGYLQAKSNFNDLANNKP